jgi:hypothetical protein
MRMKGKSDDTTRPRLRSRIRLVAGLSGLGSVGFGVWMLGPAVGYLFGIVLVLANFVLVWTAIFITREEPSRRLVHLIKVLLGRR